MNADRVEIDAELVESVISKMKRGKAPGLDGITAEHLQFCHYILPCILAKLFNLIIRSSYVPTNFGKSYTVPILKVSNVYGKSLTVEDFRGVSISPVISKFWNIAFLTDMDISLKRLITNLVLRRD